MKKLYLIDGMALVFRAYHAMSRSNLMTPYGEPTGAVFVFTNILTSFLEKEQPEKLVVVFDRAEPTFRHKIYPLYKANRDAFPEDLVPQLENIKKMLSLMSIPQLELPGYEADDIIGTLTKKAEENDVEVYCITSDKDYFQLVDKHVRVYKPTGNAGEFELIGISDVKDKWGVEPEQIIDVLALIGDTSDNIPGVKGIGEKTAIPLIQEFGSVENLYDNLDKVEKKSVREKLKSDRESAFLAKQLVTIDLNSPIDTNYDNFILKEPQWRELDSFFAKIGFNTLRKKWQDKAGDKLFAGIDLGESDDTTHPITPSREGEKTQSSIQSQDREPKKILTIKDVAHKYILVDTPIILKAMLEDLNSAEFLSFDLETSSLDKVQCQIVGIALCGKEGKAYYIPVDERLDGRQSSVENLKVGVEITEKEKKLQSSLFNKSDEGKDKTVESNYPVFDSSLSTEYVIENIKSILESNKVKKIGQNCKFDAYILKRYGVNVTPILFDSMIGSYILNPDSQHNLDALSLNYLSYQTVPISSLIGEKKAGQISMRIVDPKLISDYACEDADIAYKLKNKIYPELKNDGLLKLAEEIEFPMIETLVRVESNGVAINTDALSGISEKIDEVTVKLTEKIYKEASFKFNIDSPKQLGHVLFEKMMITPIKKGKTGYSTDVSVLTQLAETYPIAEMILEYRQLVKLKSTYVNVLPKLINPITGRIHTTYNQTIASTGRLSSTDPNLQNIPIRSELGKEIRRAFIPGAKNAVLLSADYSQIELRIMAHICNDNQLTEGFKQGLDIHAATASILFDKDIKDVNSDMRRIAKTVNFGIMYGLGSFGLSQRLGMPRDEAQEIIDNYFKKYPGIKKYIDITKEKTRKLGYAETLCGRRRYFPDILSKNNNLRTAAERAAINMPIQGTASDMMKIAMISIDNEMQKQKMKSLMMLQVHDELVFEAMKDELDELREMVIEKMRDALPLGDVPVEVDTGIGKNWFEAH